MASFLNLTVTSPSSHEGFDSREALGSGERLVPMKLGFRRRERRQTITAGVSELPVL